MRERFAISVNRTSAHLWTVEARRCEINNGTVSEMILYRLRNVFFHHALFCLIIEKFKRKITKISVRYRAALGRVCLKLVIVMGVTWICDVLSWAIGGPQYIW